MRLRRLKAPAAHPVAYYHCLSRVVNRDFVRKLRTLAQAGVELISTGGTAKALKAGDHGVPGGENMMVCDDGSIRYFTLRETARLVGLPDNYGDDDGRDRRRDTQSR